MFQELIKIETIAKNIPLLICIAWLYTQNNRITTLEDKLQNCWLLKTSNYNDFSKLPHLHTNKYAVLPDEIDVKKYIS